ncbi:TadE/TadG family type IV pilus assembly protein [Streptomyces sp. NPDC089799]|uniref:TadE/TadG family type IV pilus assembly protein n=1 Tax=Streptomyces sp. NPDC089799 TaxID=3155066 RepID=UPI00341F2FED
MRREARRGKGDQGQVAIEFAGMLPLILLLIAAVWECVLIGYAFSLAGNAADEGARAGAVGGNCGAAATQHIGGGWNVGTPVCGQEGNLYRARVTLRIPVLVPGLNTGLEITGEAGAAVEKEEDR